MYSLRPTVVKYYKLPIINISDADLIIYPNLFASYKHEQAIDQFKKIYNYDETTGIITNRSSIDLSSSKSLKEILKNPH